MTRTTNPTVDADRTNAADVLVHTDIAYATHDGVDLRGDLYAPRGGGPFPVVVAAPGGGWLFCDRSALKYWGNYLAQHGIALFAIQYRVAGASKMFPEAICDVVSAVQFVRGSANELGIDPDRVALLGSSAGAHVASLAALGGDTPLFRNSRPANVHAAVNTDVKAFVGIYGVYDLFALWQQEIADFATSSERRSERFIGVPPYADRQLYFDASPLSYVRYSANKLSVFLAYGTADDVVNPHLQSEQFLRALKQANFPVRAYPVSGAGHFWFSEEPIGEPGGFVGFLAPRLLRFLQRNL
ncbi:alpha/beta hydrolase [Chelativorans alearense]|uniref:alpha/beta hydrolase n=1 Tax=Chelativorans alearense TaxID=2681495 RepID=UPI0013D47AB7|nr:alpha/beta hydrolase [Chelativorans alearense]